MRSMRRAVVVILGALALSAPVAASALPQYPDPPISIDVDVDVCGGDPVTFTGTSATSGDWTVALDGVTRTGTGATFVAEFPVEGIPQASAPAGAASSATEATFDLGAAFPAIAPGETRTLTYSFSNAAGEITQSTQVSIPVCGDVGADADAIDGGLSDADADANGNNGLAGILPNTGGPAWWILLIGLVLVVGGATVALRTRRS